MERVPCRALDQPGDQVVGGALAEHLADQLLRAALRELVQPELLDAALRPQPREQLVDVRARERDHEPRPVGQCPQRGIDQLRRRQITPVQILEDDHERLRRGLDGDEVLERTAHLIGHQLRVLARCGQLRGVLVGERHAHQLAEEQGRSRQLRARVAHHACAQLLAAHLDALAIDDARAPP